MHKSLDAVCTALDGLSTAITSGWNGETTFTETWGWNCPSLTRHDMAALPKRLEKRIRDKGAEEIDPSLLPQINDLPRRLQFLQTSTVPQLWGSNCPLASSAIIGTIETLEKILYPVIGPQVSQEKLILDKEMVEAAKLLQHTLNKLRGIEARTSEIILRSENLHEKIERIELAYEAADQLPIDLEELKEKRYDVARLLEEAVIDRAMVNSKMSEIKIISGQLEEREKKATAILDRCDKAYRATTSEGLASAFSERSRNLSWSMWVWVFGLVVALAIGARIGSNQLHALAKAITDTQTSRQDGSVWVDLILTMLSIGAPIWFAWVSTKQIGQRFRLAEDYGYKASISKAYEGYRREAELLDPAFQNRLFSSALTRLDEIPLRLVETTTHGSPWHELASSDVIRQAITMVPDFVEKVKELAKHALPLQSQENKAVHASQKKGESEVAKVDKS